MFQERKIIKPLEINTENVINSFNKNFFHRQTYVLSLAHQLISSESTISLAIDGTWGSGKTFILKQLELVIKIFSDPNFRIENESFDFFRETCFKFCDVYLNNPASVNVVYFNAWQNDQFDFPLISLLVNIIDQLGIDDKSSYIDKAKEKLFKIIRNVNLSFNFGSIGFNIGKDQQFNEEEIRKIDNEFYKARSQQEFINNLDEFFKNITIKDKRLILLIDELDRCRPDFAVQLLEQIKIFLGKYNISVVFSINREEFESVINSYYGESFNSINYLDRFFDLTLRIPYIKPSDYFDYLFPLNSQEENYSIKASIRGLAKSISNEKRLSLRNIQRYITVLRWFESDLCKKWRNKIQSSLLNEPQQRELYITYFYFPPIIIYLYLFEPAKVNDFLKGKESNLFIDLLKERNENETIMDKNLKDFLENLGKKENPNSDNPIRDGLEKVYFQICNRSKYSFSDEYKSYDPNHENDYLDQVLNTLKNLLITY